MHYVDIVKLDEVRQWKNEWNTLVLEMEKPSVFCTWEWVESWWLNFRNGYDAYVFLVFEEEKLIGILPLAARRMVPEDGVVPVRLLTFCGSLDLYPDHLDIISSAQNAVRCWEASLEALNDSAIKWDVMLLSHFYENTHLESVLRRKGMRYDISEGMVAPYIDISMGIEKYLMGFSGKRKHNINRLRNRLFNKYGAEMLLVAGENDKERMERCLCDLFELHRARKTAESVKSSFLKDKIVKFHYGLAERMGEKGWLRLASLRCAGQTVAVGYGFNFAGCFNYFQSGMDPAWEKESVGTTLLLELIRNACGEGCREFDFLQGGEAYKGVWTRASRKLLDIRIYNGTLAAKLFAGTYGARNLLKKAIVDMGLCKRGS